MALCRNDEEGDGLSCRGGALMNATDVFVTLTELAQELGVGCATIRRWAGRAAVPLFRRAGERDALVRRADIARLRALLAATMTARALAPDPA
jgi:Trp operon repressor